MSRDAFAANSRQSAPNWRANHDLIPTNYFYDAVRRKAGGVYLSRNMEATRRARNDAWVERVRGAYGSVPMVQYFVTPLAVGNALSQTIEEADAQDTWE